MDYEEKLEKSESLIYLVTPDKEKKFNIPENSFE